MAIVATSCRRVRPRGWANGRKAATFRVRQAEPTTTKLGLQDAVFLVQVGDHLLLVTLEPASDHGDQDMEDHDRSSGWRHDELVRSSIHPT